MQEREDSISGLDGTVDREECIQQGWRLGRNLCWTERTDEGKAAQRSVKALRFFLATLTNGSRTPLGRKEGKSIRFGRGRSRGWFFNTAVLIHKQKEQSGS